MKICDILEKDISDLKLSIHGNFISRGIGVACELEIFDNFDDLEMMISLEELSEKAGSNPYSFKKLLNFLVIQGLLGIDEDSNKYTITPKGLLLKKDHVPSLHYFARLHSISLFRKASDFLLESIKNNKSGTGYFCSGGMFEYLSQNPKESFVFNKAMCDLTNINSKEISSFVSQLGATNIIDAGGGVGTLLCSVLKNNPLMRGFIVDLPYLEKEALFYIKHCELEGRIEFVSKSFFEDFKLNGDIVLLHHVLHDYEDEMCLSILENCKKSLSQDGSILVIETLLGEDPTIGIGWLKDLIMHTTTLGGRVRRLNDFLPLFDKVNLKVNQIHVLDQTSADISIIELQVKQS